ncbi:DUF1553 domain-containing protein [Rubripirellula amarantea]
MLMRFTLSLFGLLALNAFAVHAFAVELRVYPEAVTLHGPEGQQRISVVTTRDGYASATVDLADLQIESTDASVAKVSGGVVFAVGNGEATITVSADDGSRATATVSVVGAGESHEWSFRNDVQSVLAKQGCNMGACHGALAGKGGFRLSLRGYDSDSDYAAIALQARGRRIEMGDPGQSLLLAKPTGALPHKGGLKLDVNSRDYEVLAQWIASGAKAPSDEDATLEHISVMPELALLAPEEHSQVLVSAHYDDGRVVDVTHWSQFSATDEAVASVEADGKVTVRGSGESAVLVWFGSKVALARMTVPYQNDISTDEFDEAPRKNFIDELNLQQLATLKLPPSPTCSDDEFLRRATIDCIGRLPRAEEIEQYRDQPESTRRDWLIEHLLSSEDYVDYWAYKWSDMLVINGTRLRPIAVKTYYQWVHQRVRDNMPWDQLVREVLTAKGRSDENGATNFYALNQSPEEMTESACQAFMGLSIGCAKCHNHPLEKWTNDQYYAMANLFARVRAKGWGGDGRNGDGLRTLYVVTDGDLIQPKNGKPQPPAPLDAPSLAIDDPNDRREPLAQWMTSPENPYFARSITNRIWANFFGRGLVEQVDDLRHSNPASNEPLLAAAAEHLIDAKFDLKQLMRAIMRSETYARSSVPLAMNRSEEKYMSRYYPRRMMAEVLLDSIDQVLGTSTDFTRLAFPGADYQDTDFYEKGTRAIELYDAAVDSYFLKTFGRNPREIVCECERSQEPSMVQVLHMSNGETINPKLADEDNFVNRAIKEGKSDIEIIEALFERALVRKPTDNELENMLSIIAEYGDDRKTAMQDVAWSVLTSTEFTFNH